ncbi:MAG TPA: GNAT family N-acetyltransferase [Gemmatimonadaceae bacterium]|nr:GNAT family N-acetyltransferase [Gemmatimonadaceae bacterium]
MSSDPRGGSFTLHVAETPQLVSIARTLVAEYAALPHTVGRWPTAAADIAALPGPYVPPNGVLLVALEAGQVGEPTPEIALGCGALGALSTPRVAELKRIYVRPHARGRGLGKAITLALIEWADALGFDRVRLDTAPELMVARALYTQLGFIPIPPYREGLLADAVCMERAVRV